MSERPAAGGDTLDLEGQRALAAVLRGLGSRQTAVRVGRYEIGESLGRGACGQVFAARDPKLDREVAIKVVLADRDDADPAAQDRLVREGQALAQLQHPQVVPVFDVGVGAVGIGPDGRPRRGVYIVMARIRGRTLAAWLRDTSPRPDAIVRAFLQAARGLAAAHAIGIVHRDFKPGNAMVTDAGDVVVLDFGLARSVDESASLSTDREGVRLHSGGRTGSGSLTTTGFVMGTPRYMAPEQHDAQPASPASDQYAWCVALWEALTGAPPFTGASMRELAQAKRAGRLPRTPAIPGYVRRVLERGMLPDADDRFPSMTALVEALQRAPARRRRRGLALASIAVATAAIGLATRPVPRPAICVEAIDAPWSSAQIAAIDASLAANDVRDASLPARVHARIDRFARRWEDSQQRLCAAPDGSRAVAHGECLARARSAFVAATDALTQRGPDTPPWLSALWSLPSLSRCEHADASTAFVRSTADGPEIEALRARAERVVLHRDKDLADIAAVSDRALAAADAIDDHALATFALLLRVHLAMNERRFSDAAEAASLAAWRAQGAGDELLAAEILPDALLWLTIHGAAPPDIDSMMNAARQISTALADPPLLVAQLDLRQATALEFRGEHDRALALYVATAERLAAHPVSGGPNIRAESLIGAAQIHLKHDRPWAARHLFAAAIEAVPPDSKVHGLIEQTETFRSRAALATGRWDEAASSALRAVAGLDTSDARPELRALAVGWYGFVIGVRGQLDEGRALLEPAIETLRSSRIAFVSHELMEQLAYLHILADEPARALAITEALREMQAADPRHAAELPRTWAMIALLHARMGEIEASSTALSRAESIATRDAADDRATAEAILGARAELAVARRDFGSARQLAIERLGSARLHDGTPLSCGELGETYGLLARAMIGVGDREQARSIVDLADAALVCADPSRRAKRLALARLRAAAAAKG